MTDRATMLTEPEKFAIVAALANIRDQLDQAGEQLAAVHISHALDCLDPKNPIDRQDACKLH